jgi:hypothetical protein
MFYSQPKRLTLASYLQQQGTAAAFAFRAYKACFKPSTA